MLKIGVFVNESVEMIQKIADECGLTHVQLHGDEDNYQIRRLNIPSIKSLGVTSESDMKNAQSMKQIIYYLIAERKVSWRKWKDIFLGVTCAYAKRITRENDISWWIKCS